MEEFKQRLRECRRNMGLTQQEAAEQLDIYYRTYRRYEAGETEPDISIAVKLADFFQVSLDYLTGQTDNPKINP